MASMPPHNGGADGHRAMRSGSSFSRPFTPNEAMPFSPFTSVTPFYPGVIPNPTLGSGFPGMDITDQVPRQEFDLLNHDAALPSSSKRLDQTLHQVHQVLQPNTTSTFTFKKGPKVSTDAQPTRSLASELSPLTKLVYDQVKINFRYPSPDSTHVSNEAVSQKPATPASEHSPVVSKKKRKSSAISTAEPHGTANQHAHAQSAAKTSISISTQPPRGLEPAAFAIASEPLIENGAAPTSAAPTSDVFNQPESAEQLASPRKTPPKVAPDAEKDALQIDEPFSAPTASQQARETIKVNIPACGEPDQEKHHDYKDYIQPPQELSRQRASQSGFDDSQFGFDIDHRQKSDAAFQDLQRQFNAVFKAERGLETQGPQLVFLVNQETATMTSVAHQRMYQALEKVISLRCFEDVPLDDLLHVQRLCSGALEFAEGLEFRITESWGEDEVHALGDQLNSLDTGLKAARTSLKIMTGGREDRQVYSQDTIQLSINLFKKVVEDLIVPVTELRPSGPKASGSNQSLFSLLGAHKKAMQAVVTSCQRLYSLMTSLISAIDLSDTVVSTLEFISTQLMFVENGTSDQSSLLGPTKFDRIRLVAMDMVSHIFVLNPAQRQGIFDDILTSLEKLPVTKHSARQLRLAPSNLAIQPVSALIMRLIQASAVMVDSKNHGRSRSMLSDDDGGDDGEDNTGPAHKRPGAGALVSAIFSEDEAATQHKTALRELRQMESSVSGQVDRNAVFVIQFMVGRALRSTKTGDSPYRNLLDLFVEDFVTCLDMPDWPAAEILLTTLTRFMVSQWEGERTPAPAKNMALEILGTVCAAMSRLTSQVKRLGAKLILAEMEPLSSCLSDLSASAAKSKASNEQVADWSGPYRAVLEHLQGKVKNDPHLTSAISLIASQWANTIIAAEAESHGVHGPQADEEYGRLAYRLRMIIQDHTWLSTKYEFPGVSEDQAMTSYAIILAQSPLNKAFPHILRILMNAMSSDQATVRSKSLKSINQVIDTDPSILDGDSQIVQLLQGCLQDSSTQVRDSALGLVGRCIALRPALELTFVEYAMERTTDSGVGVRKRAMKLLKDIYHRRVDRKLRAAISNRLLFRVIFDQDEGVRELGRQMVEETWIFPFFYPESSTTDKAKQKIDLAEHISLMVSTMGTHPKATESFEKILQMILSPQSKTHSQSSQACRNLVAAMFDLMATDDSAVEDSSTPSGRAILQLLSSFAMAEPKLFDFEQIRLLRPYVASISSNMSPEDATTVQAAVTIYRRVLPKLSGDHNRQFLIDMRGQLLQGTSKYLTTGLLEDIIACACIVSEVLGDFAQLAALSSSALAQIQRMNSAQSTNEKGVGLIVRYIQLASFVGKHCHLDQHMDTFKKKLGDVKDKLVSTLMINTLIPLARKNNNRPIRLRTQAVEAIGNICQSHPREYVSLGVCQIFQQAFDEGDENLEASILRSLKGFLTKEELRSEQAFQAASLNGPVKSKAAKVSKKELTVMGGTSYDDVASATTQRFLKDITRIALGAFGQNTKMAVEVLGSINRQGLVHPKETGVTMMTLETCPNKEISALAFQEHKLLHEKHESVLEREYAKALQSIFQYQCDVVKDAHGAIRDERNDVFIAKLYPMMDHLKISKSKNRQGFLRKLCGLLNFEPTKLSVDKQPLPSHVGFTRFLVENIAFFDYMTVGELQLTISLLEKLVTSTGTGIAHAIESDVFQVRLHGDGMAEAQTNGTDSASQPLFAPPVDAVRFRRLTAASMILSAVWETRSYLRRLYGLKTERRTSEVKAKASAKDASKAPVKAQNVTGDKFWDEIEVIMSSLSSEEQMMAQCRNFVDLLNDDKDYKVADEDDMDEGMDGDEPHTPSGDEDEVAPDSGARGRKRKAANTPGGRKKRPRSSSQPRKRGRPRKNPVVEEDAGDDWY